jgi:flagellar motor protein MotB
MMNLTRPHQMDDEEEESYFVSMTDMMVGLLFIFIIMLMYFAIQLQNRTKALSDARDTRDEILKEIQQQMGARVEVNPQTGVVHLHGDTLFDKGSADIKPEGLANIERLAGVMARVPPCNVGLTGLATPPGCHPSGHLIDAVLVEGHTDSDVMMGARDNRDLSADRAIKTFRKLIEYRPDLGRALNRPPGSRGGEPLLSVSGYGPDRPIEKNDTEAHKARNRRIDIRFIMATPELAGEDQVINHLKRGIGGP